MSEVIVVLVSAAEGVITAFGPFSAFSNEADRLLENLDLRGGRSAKIVDLVREISPDQEHMK